MENQNVENHPKHPNISYTVVRPKPKTIPKPGETKVNNSKQLEHLQRITVHDAEVTKALKHWRRLDENRWKDVWVFGIEGIYENW